MKYHKGFTLTELLIVVAIIGIVAAIVLPVFALARGKARASACTANIRQLTQAIHLYCSDNDERYPNMTTWIRWYTDHPQHQGLVCPSTSMPRGKDEIRAFPGYNMNFFLTDDAPSIINSGMAQSAVRYPAATVLLCEQGYNENGGMSVIANGCLITTQCSGDTGEKGFLRHFGGANYSFVDGHVKWRTPEQVYDLNTGSGNVHPAPFDGSYSTFQAR